MEYINTGNIFENERITSNDFIRITENIIKRELTAEEIHQLLNIVKSNGMWGQIASLISL